VAASLKARFRLRDSPIPSSYTSSCRRWPLWRAVTSSGFWTITRIWHQSGKFSRDKAISARPIAATASVTFAWSQSDCPHVEPLPISNYLKSLSQKVSAQDLFFDPAAKVACTTGQSSRVQKALGRTGSLAGPAHSTAVRESFGMEQPDDFL
jgi:hypothetical protein